MMPDPLALAAIRAYCEKAHPLHADCTWWVINHSDAEFIRRARTDLPRCLDVIEALRAALARHHDPLQHDYEREEKTCRDCQALALVTGGTNV